MGRFVDGGAGHGEARLTPNDGGVRKPEGLICWDAEKMMGSRSRTVAEMYAGAATVESSATGWSSGWQ